MYMELTVKSVQRRGYPSAASLQLQQTWPSLHSAVYVKRNPCHGRDPATGLSEYWVRSPLAPDSAVDLESPYQVLARKDTYQLDVNNWKVLPSQGKADFAPQEWEKVTVHPDRVAWIVPPEVKEANAKENGRGQAQEIAAEVQYFDRVKKRKLFMGYYEVSAGVLNWKTFGVPVPRIPFVVMDGEKEQSELPSY
ncbi:hypothetical protein R3P38DRAFT_2759640 [Favolaschia claudopus]|uniref:Uncharacterized protein n=1 Tax=Favolaschia claudopus TaxID=2862362 RepID=A0AAW0E163_9AGAR